MARLGRAFPIPPLIQRRHFVFKPLSGAVAGVSTLSGDLERVRGLSGSIDGTAAVSGEVYRTRPLSGVVAGVASLSGEVYRVRPLSGAVAAVSSLSGTLNPYRGLSGTIAAQAAFSGLLYRLRDLSGSIDAVATLSGNLYVIWALGGTIAGVAYLVATLDALIAEPRPPRGIAIGDEALTGISGVVEGLAGHGITATPILPGRGDTSRTPSGTGRVVGLPSGTAQGQGFPRPGSAGVVEGTVGHGAAPAIPSGKGAGAASEPANFDENPSFETDLVGVTVTNGTKTQSGSKARYGSYSCRVEATTSSVEVIKHLRSGAKFPVNPGEEYQQVVRLQMDTGGFAILSVGLDWYDAGDLFISKVATSVVVGDSAWVSGQPNSIAPAEAAGVELSIVGVAGTWGAGEALFIDGQELRPIRRVVSYVDGDQPDCYWHGTPHASASERTPTLALSRGEARATRTVEGRATTGRSPQSGKAR